MWFPKASLFCSVAIIAAIGFAACNNTCVTGFVDNGKGSVTIKVGNPAPSCPLTSARAAIKVVILKPQVCEACAAGGRVEHLFVTIQSIQLRPAIPDYTNKDWLEIAPELANQSRQIDLMGNSSPEMLVANANIPAETYSEIRVRFSSDSDSNAQEFHGDTVCGNMLRNCIVMADGRIEPLQWPGNTPELIMAIRPPEGDSLLVLPDSIVDLQLSLELQRSFHISSIQQLSLQNALVGRAIADPRSSNETDNLNSN